MIALRQPENCTSCGAAVGCFDLWCGSCGCALAQIRWRGADKQEWGQGDGKLAIQPEASSVRIVFGNAGVVPAGLVLRAVDIESLPPWVDGTGLSEQTFVLPPGPNSQVTLELPLKVAEFRRLFDSLFHRNQPPELEAVRLEARLTLVTTLAEFSDGASHARTFEISLLVAKEPWLVPGRSVYRFLPVERLRDPGLVHTLELRNEAAEEIRLNAIDLVENLSGQRPDARRMRLPIASILSLQEHRFPVAIQPGASCHAEVRLSLAEGELPAGRVGWFSGWVEFSFERAGKPNSSRALIQGTVGRGPTLELVGAEAPLQDGTLWIGPDSLSKEHVLTLRNPGDIPVRLLELSSLLGEQGDTSAPARDWLELRGVGPQECLGPGEEREVRVHLRPDRRPAAEYDAEWCSRRLTFHHDGWEVEEEARCVQLQVKAHLGVVEDEAIAGIDFGTSNSMVCVVKDDEVFPLSLEFGEAAAATLASLMFYDSRAAATDDHDGFLYGDDAHASAGVNPVNLVRSIKTVVSKRPDNQYVFLNRGADGTHRRDQRSARELLNLFIDELRRRAERGVSMMDPRAREALRLRSSQVVFRRAVFSHPVNVSADMKRALMDAAHAAGINRHLQDEDTFFAKSCVDEATAAVLAYVRCLVDPERDMPHSDAERILCFDMGGGTTDIAAVEVGELSSFIEGDAEQVQLTLTAKDGDSAFGGDDLDQILAGQMVRGIREQCERWGVEPDMTDIDHAVHADSFAQFLDGFRKRVAIETRTKNPDCDEAAQRVFGLARELLTKAEYVKRQLTDLETVNLVLTAAEFLPSSAKDTEANFEFDFGREEFEATIRAELEPRLKLLDQVINAAGWTWDSVTTLLFTGQSVRVPIIRKIVKERAHAARADQAANLRFVEPGNAWAFDPKECVARGAAVWGENNLGPDPWLSISVRMREQLTYNLQTKRGPRYRTVDGLSAGEAFPAKAVFEKEVPFDRLVLYRGGQRYVQFRFAPTNHAVVCVEGPGEYWIEIDGQRTAGEVEQ